MVRIRILLQPSQNVVTNGTDCEHARHDTYHDKEVTHDTIRIVIPISRYDI